MPAQAFSVRLSVIGCGHLGAAHAASMVELGHDVVGVDVDTHKASLLDNGRAPFSEPELERLLVRGVEAGRLTFTQGFSAIKGAQVHFIGVGTPQSESGTTDATYVDAAVTAMLPHSGYCTSGPGVVVDKSTTPAGAAVHLSQLIRPTGVLLLWNPEFLREGLAVQGMLRPDRTVYGLPEGPDAAGRAQETTNVVCVQILVASTPRLVMNYATAELVKISANTFLATKISFINAMSQICDAAGADVTAPTETIGMDDRIGRRSLRAGIGFDGGCLSKDIRTFQTCAGELGVGNMLAFLAEVDHADDATRAGVIHTVTEFLVEYTSTAMVTVLGAAFKPDSGDIRSSLILDFVVELPGMIERVVVHDPAAGPILTQRMNCPYEVTASTQSALEGTDPVIIGTERREYQDLDLAQAAGLARNRHIIDGRNCLDAQAWKAAGWSYRGIGRW